MAALRCEGWGRLGAAPEIRRSDNGGRIWATFSLAFNESWEEHGRRVKRTTWLDCVAFGELADRLGRCGRGEEIFVQGTVQMDAWTDPDGRQHRKHELKVLRAARTLAGTQPAGAARGADPAPG